MSEHYNDVIMGAMACQITSLAIFYSTVYSGADLRKSQSSVSPAFVQGIHRRPVNSRTNGQLRGKCCHHDTMQLRLSWYDKIRLDKMRWGEMRWDIFWATQITNMYHKAIAWGGHAAWCRRKNTEIYNRCSFQLHRRNDGHKYSEEQLIPNI